jgi:hypothetical protein
MNLAGHGHRAWGDAPAILLLLNIKSFQET